MSNEVIEGEVVESEGATAPSLFSVVLLLDPSISGENIVVADGLEFEQLDEVVNEFAARIDRAQVMVKLSSLFYIRKDHIHAIRVFNEQEN